MTCEEFSNAFDILLNSYKHKSEFGEGSSLYDITLDEYEKSIFLTQAQDIVVKRYFNRALNAEGEGFDDSSKRQLDFSNLISVATIDGEAKSVNTPNSSGVTNENGYALNSLIFNLESLKILFIINERVVATSGTGTSTKYINRTIVPISYKEYDRQMSKAYSEPLKRQAWRLFNSNAEDTALNAEVVMRSDDFKTYKNSFKYVVRYIRRPKPIVLVDLSATSNDLMIDGEKEKSECELNPVIHQEILQEAVNLVLMSNGIQTRDAKAAASKE